VPLRVHGKVTAVLITDNGDAGPVPGVGGHLARVQHGAARRRRPSSGLLDTADSARKFRVLRKLQEILAGAEDTKRFGDSLSAMLSMMTRAGGGTGALLKDFVRGKTLHVRSVEELDDAQRDADIAVTECFDDILERVADSMKPVRGDSAHAMLSDVAAQRIRFISRAAAGGGRRMPRAVAFYVESAAETSATEFPARDRLFLELCAGMLAERLDSLYRADIVRRSDRMLEEARSNWLREKVASGRARARRNRSRRCSPSSARSAMP
jgi:hypothetical protein